MSFSRSACSEILVKLLMSENKIVTSRREPPMPQAVPLDELLAIRPFGTKLENVWTTVAHSRH